MRTPTASVKSAPSGYCVGRKVEGETKSEGMLFLMNESSGDLFCLGAVGKSGEKCCMLQAIMT